MKLICKLIGMISGTRQVHYLLFWLSMLEMREIVKLFNIAFMDRLIEVGAGIYCSIALKILKPAKSWL